MRKTKFISVLVAVVMVLTMSVSAFATSSPKSPNPGSGSGSAVTKTAPSDVTAVDENGKEVPVEAKDLAKTDDTMKTVTEAGDAEKLIDAQEQKLAAAVALAPQSADLDDLKVAAAKSIKAGASEENPITVTMPIAAAEAKGSVVVMEKTADGWTVVPATIEEGKVSATLTADGDVVVMVAPASAEAPVEEAEVPEGAWYEQYENFAIIADIVTPEDAKPEEVVTRGEFVKMLYAMANKPTGAAANEFTDMEGFEDYEDAINWAVANGICIGYGDGTVKCGKQITREEMVKMLYNFAVYQKGTVTETTDLDQYTDADEVSTWAETAVKWANATEIVVGTSETTLEPSSNSMRCQAFTVLYRYVVAK